MKWEDLNEIEFKEKKFKRAFLPVGTIESHGIGPLGTDCIVPYNLCIDLAPLFDGVVLPLLPYGITSGLYGRPGSISLSSDTFERLIFEIITSVYKNGIKELFIMNGHGGQITELKNASKRAHFETGIKICVLNWWICAEEISDKYFGNMTGHGGADEIAMVYAKKSFKIDFKNAKSFSKLKGIDIFPYPYGMLLYKKGKIKKGFEKLSKKYYREVLEYLKKLIKEIIEGWESM